MVVRCDDQRRVSGTRADDYIPKAQPGQFIDNGFRRGMVRSAPNRHEAKLLQFSAWNHEVVENGIEFSLRFQPFVFRIGTRDNASPSVSNHAILGPPHATKIDID